jgi:hypothetical protein
MILSLESHFQLCPEARAEAAYIASAQSSARPAEPRPGFGKRRDRSGQTGRQIDIRVSVFIEGGHLWSPFLFRSQPDWAASRVCEFLQILESFFNSLRPTPADCRIMISASGSF